MGSFNRFLALVAFPALLACAQDISGDWQGVLKTGAQDVRILLQIAKSDNGEWKATMLSIDQSPDWGAGAPVTSFSQNASNIQFAIGAVRGSYEGKLNAGGESIGGTWTQGRALPLEFRRATKETAWLDPSPHRARFIAVGNNIKLEVLDWGGTGRPLVLLAVSQAIMAGMQKYTDIPVPALAIYAAPHATGQPYKDDAERVAAETRDEANTGAQAKAFESGVPSARVVRLPHASHYVFFSNEADVLREMNAFLGNLPRQN
jgi:hypothetical protein